jgi:hypothetical protein
MRVFRRTPNVLYDLLGEQAVLIDAQGTEIITLNRLGTLVWQALDGEHDANGIVRQVTAMFEDIDPQRITQDVELFLDELNRLSLVVEVPGGSEEPRTG